MALQTCKRCRKRRIKCDLQLPSCSSCQLADTECLFFDDSLGHEVPRSYLHALNAKVDELEAEIRNLKAPGIIAPSTQLPDPLNLLQSRPGDFHPSPYDSDRERHVSVSATSYLGPGSSAELLDNLLNTLVRRQLSHDSLPNFISKFRDGDDEHSLSFPALNLKINPGKLEVQSLQHPQIQRALIEYYAKAVQPNFPILSSDQLRLVLGYENPLRQSATEAEKLFIHGILAVSSALVARDLDRDQTVAASLWMEKLYDHINRSGVTDMKQTVLALCFLALLDMICPGSSKGSTWEVVGMASRMYVKLYEELSCSLGEHPDDDCQRLGFCLYSFESIIAVHFRRPSIFCNSAPSRISTFAPEYEFLSPSFHVHHATYMISQHFTLTSDPTSIELENLIPPSLRIPSSSCPSEMSLAQAQVYLALHPLFTSPDAGPHSCSPELLRNIAGAAAAFIACTSKLNKEHRIISIWTTAETVLQAGAVWGAYLVLSKQGESNTLQDRLGSSMETLLQCSALLASFAERWKGGRHYVQAWDAFVEMLWVDLDLQQTATNGHAVSTGPSNIVQ